jgi:serine phosphatase RsbU (regulator of sigma subunit)
VLAQIDGDGSVVEILSCGHPPPPPLVRDGTVTTVELPPAGRPLGLAALHLVDREVCVVPFKHGDRLLFYTDGVSEARDKHGTFYPLERAGMLLQGQDLGSVLDGLIKDVLAHVGHALLDDAALLLIGREQPSPATCRPVG